MYISPLRSYAGRFKRELLYRLDFANNRRCARLASYYELPGGYKRIYHYHIRKTGGTSLNTLFLSTSGEGGQKVYQELNNAFNQRIIKNGKVLLGWNPRLINQGHFFYAFSHLPAHQLSLPPKTFTITCLRDPIKRLLSLYRMLMEQVESGDNHPGLKVQKKYLKSTFLEFFNAIPEEERFNQLYMFSKSMNIDEAFKVITNCHMFFFTEQFDAGIKEINDRLGFQMKPVHLRKSKKRISLSDQDLRYLRDRLSPEYRLLSLLSDQ